MGTWNGISRIDRPCLDGTILLRSFKNRMQGITTKRDGQEQNRDITLGFEDSIDKLCTRFLAITPRLGISRSKLP